MSSLKYRLNISQGTGVNLVLQHDIILQTIMSTALSYWYSLPGISWWTSENIIYFFDESCVFHVVDNPQQINVKLQFDVKK